MSEHVDADLIERLIELLVEALAFDRQKLLPMEAMVHQVARANLVTGVLKDHRDDSSHDLARLERTIKALEDVACGAEDDGAMRVLRLLGLG